MCHVSMGIAMSSDPAVRAVYSSLCINVPLITYRLFTNVAVNWGLPFWSMNVAWLPPKVTNQPSLSNLLIDIRILLGIECADDCVLSLGE